MCSALQLHKLLVMFSSTLNTSIITSPKEVMSYVTAGSASMMSAKFSIYWRDKPTGNSFIV